MPRIRCHYIDCVFIDDGYCSAAGVEIDPDEGCMTYARADDLVEIDDDDWEDEDELEGWEIDDEEEDNDELWQDDDDDV